MAGLERHHRDPFWRVGEETFLADVEAVRSRIGELSDDRMTVELIRLTALIDGHGGIFVGHIPGWDFARLRFYRFDDGIGVIGAADESLVGGRLISIGIIPAEDVYALVEPLAGHDNSQSQDAFAPHFLAVPRVLAALGVIDDPVNPVYTIETVAGELVDVTPESGTLRDYMTWFGSHVVGHIEDPRSLYLQHRSAPFWWQVLPDGTIYFQYNESVASGPDPISGARTSAVQVAADLDRAMEANPEGRVIVDLRHNLGGDTYTSAPLRGVLISRFEARCGPVVIVGKETFSAAMLFALELERETGAVVVGEPTGGRGSFHADETVVVLPNSRLPMEVSTIYWENDDREWLEPDVLVPVTLEDWRSGADPALEAALAVTECGQPGVSG